MEIIDRKDISPLSQLVNNYHNYSLIYVLDPRFRGTTVERANYKNIYIYYIDRDTYDFIFLYNKSNKFFRFMIRKDKSTKSFTLVNEFFDNKVKDYFLFDEFLYEAIDEYTIEPKDTQVIEILKRLDA